MLHGTRKARYSEQIVLLDSAPARSEPCMMEPAGALFPVARYRSPTKCDIVGDVFGQDRFSSVNLEIAYIRKLGASTA